MLTIGHIFFVGKQFLEFFLAGVRVRFKYFIKILSFSIL